MRNPTIDVMPCWYVTEEEKNSAIKEVVRFHEHCTHSEYFKITKSVDICRQGYLGSLDHPDLFFNSQHRSFSYFKNYQKRSKGYFTFDKVVLFEIVNILPSTPLLFELKQINHTIMQEEKKEKIQQITINVGNGNVIANGNFNTISAQYSIKKGDTQSLKHELNKYQVDESDIAEIVAIVQEEKPNQYGKFGPKTNTWITKMINKSLEGTWEVGVAIAGGLLVEILKGFFEIS